MGSQDAAQDSSVAPPAALRPQGPGRPAGQDGRRWRYRRPAWTLPGGPGAWAALLAVWVVWGSTYIAIRVGDQSIPPLVMASTPVPHRRYPALPHRRQRRRTAAAGGRQARDRPVARDGGRRHAAAGLRQRAVSSAKKALPAGLTALLVATVPIWMVLADRIINGRAIPRASWLALIIGVAGVGILARPHGHGSIVPALIVLGGSLCWGTGSVLAGRLPAPSRPLLGSAMEMLAGGVVLAALAAVTGELSHLDPSQVSGRSALALLYLIGPGSLLAMTCYVVVLRRLPTAAVSTYAYVNPVVAVSLGALLLGEHLTPATVLGGAVVLASVALLLLHRPREYQQSRPQAQPLCMPSRLRNLP